MTSGEAMRLPSWVSSSPRSSHERPAYAVSILSPRSSSTGWPTISWESERVVVRVGDHRAPRRRAPRARAPGQLDRVAGEGERELGEGRELDQRLGDAAGEDLPAALVAEHVVDLLAVVGPGRHHVAHALGEREGLVDERALRGGEELAAELGQGGDVVVGRRAASAAADPPRDVGGEAHHLVERDAARDPPRRPRARSPAAPRSGAGACRRARRRARRTCPSPAPSSPRWPSPAGRRPRAPRAAAAPGAGGRRRRARGRSSRARSCGRPPGPGCRSAKA